MTQGAAVVRGQRDRPLLLYGAGIFLALVGFYGVLATGFMVFEALAPSDAGSFGALGIEGLTAAQFLAMSPVLFTVTGARLVLGYGLLRDRAWARPLGAFLWFGLAILVGGAHLVAGSGPELFGYSLLRGLVISGLAYWYLYGTAGVNAYYRRI